MMVAVDENTADILFISRENDGIGFETGTCRIVTVGDHMGFIGVDVLFAYELFEGFDMFRV
jgi:hypothetical protein